MHYIKLGFVSVLTAMVTLVLFCQNMFKNRNRILLSHWELYHILDSKLSTLVIREFRNIDLRVFKEKIKWSSFISFSLVFLLPLLLCSFAFNHFPRDYVFFSVEDYSVTEQCIKILNAGNYFSLEGTAEIKYLDFYKMFLFLLYRVIMYPINMEHGLGVWMLCVPQSLLQTCVTKFKDKFYFSKLISRISGYIVHSYFLSMAYH